MTWTVDFIEFNDVWMNQHSVVDDLSFDISVDLGTSFDELDCNQSAGFLVAAQTSCSKITRAQIFNLKNNAAKWTCAQRERLFDESPARTCSYFSLLKSAISRQPLTAELMRLRTIRRNKRQVSFEQLRTRGTQREGDKREKRQRKSSRG